MIKKRESLRQETKTNARGGTGDIQFTHIFEADEVKNSRLTAVITIEAGDSIGVHPHEGEGEIYVILSGAATVTEDGVEQILRAGDAEYCAAGQTHGIYNHTDEPMSMLAIVILS